MSTGLNKILKFVQMGLLGLSAILGVVFLTGGISEDVIIGWCYILLVIAALAALGFSIANMAGNPKKAKSSVIGLVAILAVFGIAYVIGSDEILPEYDGFISDPSASKNVSMGLIAFYILGAGAIAAAVFAEVSKAFK
tara:strand:- start:3008 stop:3421 length:414 start_codon:yes stop_codon:yes gene_type:complete